MLERSVASTTTVRLILPFVAMTQTRGILVPEATSDAKREEIADELGESVQRRRDDNYAESDQ
ncbi:hypothetical protein [Halococcus agarilyticus]|uniref:hypothetical protein n=1 Tax=Halococcus agarilyticus TaxID=1232219 RepID=UPI001896965F|nr:hypothetical protein [Halococcus agarilyticus]